MTDWPDDWFRDASPSGGRHLGNGSVPAGGRRGDAASGGRTRAAEPTMQLPQHSARALHAARLGTSAEADIVTAPRATWSTGPGGSGGPAASAGLGGSGGPGGPGGNWPVQPAPRAPRSPLRPGGSGRGGPYGGGFPGPAGGRPRLRPRPVPPPPSALLPTPLTPT